MFLVNFLSNLTYYFIRFPSASLPDRLARISTILVTLSLIANVIMIVVLAQDIMRAIWSAAIHTASCSSVRWSLRASKSTQPDLLLLTHPLVIQNRHLILLAIVYAVSGSTDAETRAACID